LVKQASGRRVLGLAALAVLAVGGPPRPAAALIDAVAFDRFMAASRPVCTGQPAGSCVALAWSFADSDGDQGLSVAELAAIRTELGSWALRNREQLTAPERSGLALGLLLVDSLGLERLLAQFDSDGDGALSRSELLADVRLDQRPLPETLLDPVAVDRRALARRLGLPVEMLERLEP
jgi:hypothetical protein